MQRQRIDKILSSQNIASRSETKNMIKAGRIKADGITVKRADENSTPKQPLYPLTDKPSALKNICIL